MNEELRHATEIAKDPASFSWITYTWVILLAMWGGIVRIIREVQLGDKTWKQIAAIVFCELIISAFAGVITFYLCESAEFKPLYTAVMTGVSGYMGGRSLAILETLYRARSPRGE
jgi:hypothetical protein